MINLAVEEAVNYHFIFRDNAIKIIHFIQHYSLCEF